MFQKCITCLLILISTVNCWSQSDKTDSLSALLPTANNNVKFDLLVALIEELQYTDIESASGYLAELEKMINKNETGKRAFQYYSLLSFNQLYKHEYQQSLATAEKALAMQGVASAKDIIEVYATMGTCHYYQSNYREAIDIHLKSLKLCENDSIENVKAGILNNLAVVYISMNDFAKTEANLKQAIELLEKYPNEYESGRAIGNMAIVYAMQEKYDQAETWFLKNKDFHLNRGDSISAGKAYNNLGVLYERTDQLEKALNFYQEALIIAQQSNDKASEALGYQNVAIALSKLKRFDKAINNYKIGLKMTRELGNRDKLRDGLLGISEMYESMGDTKNAFNYYKQYFLLNDSLVNEQHLNAVSELEIKYETEKKEKEILSLSEQKLLDEASLARQNIWIKRLSLGLIAAIFIFAAVFFIFRQHSEVQKKDALIEAITETQIVERKRIAQDLHDSIGGSLAMLINKLQIISDKLGSHTEIQESIQSLSKTSEQVRQISHNMMPGELVKFGLVPAIQTILEQLEATQIKSQLFTHAMDKRIDASKEIHLYRIFQEIVQNVLKHAQAKNLMVYLNRHKKQLNLMVEDDGKGMNIETRERNGLGLSNMQARVEYLKGTLNIDSHQNRGTTINIDIPV